MNNRSFTVHFSDPDSEDRAVIEQFISKAFQQSHGAKITRFMPHLMSLRDLDGKLIAACGLRSAAKEKLFLEHYLDQPIEQVLSERTGITVPRNDIVEVGNFSVAELGMARQLITAIIDQLHATSKHWAVFTVVQVLQNALIKLKTDPLILGNAYQDDLPVEIQSDWGSYYQQNPQVMAIKRSENTSII